nr:hypothetical protein [Methylobacterium sp. ZNC0032]
MTFIGIDLATSSVKAALLDDRQRLLATATRELAVARRAFPDDAAPSSPVRHPPERSGPFKASRGRS